MALIEVLRFPHQILRQQCEPVDAITDDVLKLIDDMVETMYSYKGVGLAAPQVGVAQNIIVLDVGQGLVSLINPEISFSEGTEAKEEGCLCLPDLSVTVERRERIQIKGIEMEVCRGEVIGLAGMEGSGQQLFLRALSGLVRPVNGEVIIDGKKMTGMAYHAFQKEGIYYVPAARLEEGLISGFSLTDHVVLVEKQEGFFIKKEIYQTTAQRKISEFNIHGDPTTLVEELSGGNQQRASLALLRSPHSVLLLEHPMRGLDIESSIDIWNRLKDYCRKGTTIFFTSSDLEEIMRYSDRILVFFGGKVSKPLEAEGISVDQLGQMIGGKGFEKEKAN